MRKFTFAGLVASGLAALIIGLDQVWLRKSPQTQPCPLT
jgi:hypothetical protein